MRILDLTAITDDEITAEQMLALEDPSQTLKITIGQLTAYVNKTAETVFVKKLGDTMTGPLTINTAANTDTALTLGGVMRASGANYTIKDGVYTSSTYRRAFGDDMRTSDTASARVHLQEGIDAGGAQTFLEYAITVTGVDGDPRVFKFKSDGSSYSERFVYAGGAYLAVDGNIYGSKWGGLLDAYLINGFVKDIALGAYVYAVAEEEVHAPMGNLVQGLYNPYNGSDYELRGYYYAPIKKNVSNTWWGIGEVARVAITANYQEIVMPEIGLTELINLKPFRHKDTPPNCVDFIDESGFLWSTAQNALRGNYFISYDKSGLIRCMSSEAWQLTVDALSVAALDELPQGFAIDGTWKFDGEKVYQDAPRVAPVSQIDVLKKEIAELRALVVKNG